MIVRITTVGPQETWHHDVNRVWAENGYLKLRLDAHPHQVNYWRGNGCGDGLVKVLVCATGEDVTEALRDEMSETAIDRVRRG